MTTVHEAEVQIRNRLGLHARPAAQLVRTSNRFGANVLISKNGVEVNGKSIRGVLMLAAEQGSVLLVRAEGQDAHEAVTEIVALIETGFHEDDEGRPVETGSSDP